jgi:predicted RNA-binding protein associated with RNAse of E/G family
VWWFWDDDGQFECWYVNLEERAVRWDDGAVSGVDVVDQDLDVVVAPDHSWRWKDEDEFAERLAFPEHYWVRDEAAVWAEGRRVIKIAEAGEFPFDGTWTDFVPDPSWRVPELPAGWDRRAAPRP